MTNDQLKSALEQYRSNAITIDDLLSWFKSSPLVVNSSLKRTSYLKLKRGNPLPACKETLRACENCRSIFPQGNFVNYSTFEDCDDEIKKLISHKKLVAIDEPHFVNLLPKVRGGSAFFECSCCGSIWRIVLPERTQRGAWNRVA